MTGTIIRFFWFFSVFKGFVEYGDVEGKENSQGGKADVGSTWKWPMGKGDKW